MQNFIYPATLTPDNDDGGFVVKFIDLPEAITQGENVDNALSEAADCLEEAIANRIEMGRPIPNPSTAKNGQYAVPLPAQMAAKAVLYIAIQEIGISNVDLAKKLGCDEKEVCRMLDPHHSSKIPRIEFALSAMGRKLVLGVQ
ncbi:MAG: type II toxin-antitoxin system HicB family antitoxin [Thermodesulfobacteriota bacterium]|nr:type II toxin-antitoxin system HicB family antitoxin [Thermodesulfobacteriota bacterium]